LTAETVVEAASYRISEVLLLSANDIAGAFDLPFSVTRSRFGRRGDESRPFTGREIAITRRRRYGSRSIA